MIIHFTVFVALLTLITVGRELLAVPMDLVVGSMYWGIPLFPASELIDITPILNIFFALPLFPFIFLLGAGLLSLVELD